MNKIIIPTIVVTVVIIGGVAAYARSQRQESQAMKSNEVVTSATPDAMMKEQEAMSMKKDGGAAFVPFRSEADAQKLVSDHGKSVVYFFAASWCPDCQAIKKHLQTSNDLGKLDKNTVIEEVDYDTQKDLKSKYSITHQTAFVRIDATGNAIKQAVLSTFDDVLTF